MKQKLAFGFQVFSILALILSVYFGYLVQGKPSTSESETADNKTKNVLGVSATILYSPFNYVLHNGAIEE